MSTVIQGIIVPDDSSGQNDWVQYHKALVSRFGKANANALFVKTFQAIGNTNMASDPDFKEYFDKNGIDTSNMFSSTAASLRNIGDTFMGIVGTAGTVVKYAIPVLAIVIILPVGIMLFNLARGDKKTVAMVKGVASAATPIGRASKLVK